VDTDLVFPSRLKPKQGQATGCWIPGRLPQQPLPLIVGQEADQALRRFLGLGDLQNRVVLGLLPRPLQGLHPRMLHVDRLGRIEDFRFHDLRHSAASYMLMNGASIAELAEVLGHKTPQMVKRCSHLSESRSKGIVERINRPSPGRLPDERPARACWPTKTRRPVWGTSPPTTPCAMRSASPPRSGGRLAPSTKAGYLNLRTTIRAICGNGR
jgi:hypothetical protein